MTEQLGQLVEDARERLLQVSCDRDMEQARIDFLGRKGMLSVMSGKMKGLSPEERPVFGKALNRTKMAVEGLFEEAASRLAGVSGGLVGAEAVDLTLPGRKFPVGSKHPVTRIIDESVAIFRRMGFTVADGPEIETVYNNFDALNTPADHPSRDPMDTFYFSDGRLLRTQTSPVQIRVMKSVEPPIRIVAPGRCFRRDTPDATHSMNFHQIEGLYIDRGVSMADLKGVLLAYAHELFGPDVSIRLRPHFFPFTEPSVEYDFSCIMCGGEGCPVCKNSGWLEIAGAGMVDPAVLEEVGLEPEIWSGYAFGMGIERIAMIRYRISDIRLLYENDLRFLEQF
ncbi:MAG: phenylalanine--tRNA ligase subunit alpha [Victivallales bacterium]|nr:phenylalanine--tRNA ligase subunit alpha [Victivallales bacterium]